MPANSAVHPAKKNSVVWRQIRPQVRSRTALELGSVAEVRSYLEKAEKQKQSDSFPILVEIFQISTKMKHCRNHRLNAVIKSYQDDLLTYVKDHMYIVAHLPAESHILSIRLLGQKLPASDPRHPPPLRCCSRVTASS